MLSYVYLWFLPLVPLALTAWLIWSKNITYGYWFATSQSIAWSLGTLSYYALPTLGPGLAYPSIYTDLPDTPTLGADGVAGQHPTTRSCCERRRGRRPVGRRLRQPAHRDHPAGGADGAVHRPQPGRCSIVFWVNFGLTVIATIYFGWHYIADDIAGVMIALVAFYVGGVASGQKFERHGLASHPTADSAAVPVLED